MKPNGVLSNKSANRCQLVQSTLPIRLLTCIKWSNRSMSRSATLVPWSRLPTSIAAAYVTPLDPQPHHTVVLGSRLTTIHCALCVVRCALQVVQWLSNESLALHPDASKPKKLLEEMIAHLPATASSSTTAIATTVSSSTTTVPSATTATTTSSTTTTASVTDFLKTDSQH
jgi:hypothetical protein